MRRALTVLPLTLTTLLLLALPAAAADEAVAPEGGLWDGLLLAGVLGIVAGIVFFVSLQQEPAHPDEEHDAHH